MAKQTIESFFDEQTYTVTYLVIDEATKHCAIIDPVLDFDSISGKFSNKSAAKVLARITDLALECKWILETHIHADHISAASYLREKTGAKVGVSEKIKDVYNNFSSTFDFAQEFEQANKFDALLTADQKIALGESIITVIATPGHTPACVSYHIGNAVFVGDTIFMPDFGSARCDFPAGDAATLWQSIKTLLSLDEGTVIYVGHDYKSPQRDHFAWQTTVKEQKASNIHIANTDENAFVTMRQTRDQKLGLPKLIYPALQCNLFAGESLTVGQNGRRYLKTPLQFEFY